MTGTDTVVIDTLNPTVTGVTVNDLLLTDADAGPGKLTVTVVFSEPMAATPAPALTFSPAVGTTLTLTGGTWTDATHYTATYDVADANVDGDAVQIGVTGAKDAAGNDQQDYTPADEFGIDTLNPAATSVAVSDALLSDGDTGSGKTFTVTVDFSEAMNQNVAPTIVFSTAVATTLTVNAGTSHWADADTYAAVYHVADANVDVRDVTIDVAGGQDVAGNEPGAGRNLDFENGGLSPWVPLNAGSQPGPYEIASFDVDGDGLASQAFRIAPNVDPDGIQQQVYLQAGVTYTIDLDIAAANTSANSNGGVGNVALLLDGTSISAFNFQTLGSLPGGGVQRSTLHATYTPSTTGLHTLSLTFQRPWIQDASIWAYADDVAIGRQYPTGVFSIDTWNPSVTSVAAGVGSGSNLGFESANFAPWIPLNASSQPGPYQLVEFDVDGDGQASQAFRIAPNTGTPDGIEQQVYLQAGVTYTIDADIAAANTSANSNGGVGSVAVLLDGTSVSAFNFQSLGSLPGGGVQRSNLHGTYTPSTTGFHALSLTFQRPWMEDATIWALADDVSISSGAAGSEAMLITDADATKTLIVTVGFDEPMTDDGTADSTIAFAPAVATTLSLVADYWADDATYQAVYQVADANLDVDAVQIGVTGAKDAAGNAQQAYMPADEFGIDTANPAVLVLTPADDSVGVPRDTDLTIAFSEPIRKGAGTIVVRKSADGSVVESIDVANAAVTVAGSAATIALAGPLPGSTEFYVEVVAGAFEDWAGNDFTGISGTSAWNFSTGFVVVSLTPTSTGFHVRFSQNLDAGVLNLYDEGGTLGPADLNLVGAAVGKVRGSFVIDPGLRQATFIKTAGLLQPDQYTVTLTSGATAFRDSGGWLLDGNADGTPGGDFVEGFTVSAPATNAVTVSLPNVTRGYGQPVNLPANVQTAGLPLTVSNGMGVTRVELVVQYDPTLLSISAFALDAAVASRAARTLDTSIPGRAVLTITASTGLADAAGQLIVGSFTAQVPNNAPYLGKHVLDITDLRVLDNSPTRVELPVIGDDAVHVAAFFGDGNGDGAYNSPDATLVRRIIGQLNTGLAAYQLADPVLIVDITQNGLIQSNDTSNIRRVTGHVAVPNIPALPVGLQKPAPRGADPLVYIPRDLAGAPGGTVTMPVRLQVTERAGITLSGFEVVIEYDPSHLTVTESKRGGLLSGTDVSGSLTHPAPGRLIYTASALNGTGLLAWGTVGDLFTVTFAIAEGAPAGASVLNLRSGLDSTATAVFDAQLNNLVLSPAPTDSPADRVDGLLTIRAPRPARPDWPIQDRREVHATSEAALASPPSPFVLRPSSVVRPSFFVPVPSAVDEIADELARLRVRSGAGKQQDLLDAVFGQWGQDDLGLTPTANGYAGRRP